jgi:hypothetical protein
VNSGNLGNNLLFNEWYQCIAKEGSQSSCSLRFQEIGKIPAFKKIVLSEFVISFGGILGFIVFSCKLNLWKEWRAFFKKRNDFIGDNQKIVNGMTLPTRAYSVKKVPRILSV